MLFYPIPQSLGCAPYVARITLARKFINDGIFFFVPTKQKSSVIYEFTCQCDSGYVGRTTQRLGDRIKQHVPSNIRNKTAP